MPIYIIVTSKTVILDETVHLRKNYDLKDKSQMVPGFTTSAKTRPLLISKLETYFREKGPIIHSRRTIEELYVFIWNGQRAESQKGYNDDLVMSMSIALWVRDTALKLRQQGIDLTMRSLTHIGKTSNAVVKVGGFQNNMYGKYEALTDKTTIYVGCYNYMK
jgi:hypothetical protein